MIVRTPSIERAAFEAATGWQFKPEGACKGDVCIPLSTAPGAKFDARAMAQALGLPVAEDKTHGLLAIGPESIGNRALDQRRGPRGASCRI